MASDQNSTVDEGWDDLLLKDVDEKAIAQVDTDLDWFVDCVTHAL